MVWLLFVVSVGTSSTQGKFYQVPYAFHNAKLCEVVAKYWRYRDVGFPGDRVTYCVRGTQNTLPAEMEQKNAR